MGATIAGRKAGEYAPLAITGGNLKGCEYVSPVASAQVKSSVLLAGLLAEGATTLTEPLKSRDHTERMLQYLGVPLHINGLTVSLNGRTSFQGTSLAVPGDLSAAAFFLVAGSIVPDSEILLPRVGVNPERTGILEVLIQMGANIELKNSRVESEEPVADLLVKSAPLHGVHVGPEQVPKTIDEFPILCIAAAAAEGETRITGAEELRVKETDRIRAMATELKRLNVQAEETSDGLSIRGKATIQGGKFGSYGDHRVAMSLAVAGLIAQSPLLIDDVGCVETSFPGFQGKLLDLLTNSG
jgi:3-phosphoshikimate 1-carboxyvinyltransferase